MYQTVHYLMVSCITTTGVGVQLFCLNQMAGKPSILGNGRIDPFIWTGVVISAASHALAIIAKNENSDRVKFAFTTSFVLAPFSLLAPPNALWPHYLVITQGAVVISMLAQEALVF